MKKAALLFALATTAMAQEFEVATIHRAVEDYAANVTGDKGYYRIHNFTLKRLIAMAWGVNGSEVIGGPNWVGSDHWDITSKMPAEYATRPEDQYLTPQDTFVKKMIQNLLADHFRLVIHRETRQVSGLALVVAKSGPRMAAATPQEKNHLQGDNTYLKATDFTMKELAQILSGRGTPVIDKTGLTGGYDFEIHWATDDDSSSEQPSMFTALQEQLGLKLESTRVPIEVVIIDRAEKPTAN
jgi:uncharacterized protein (TIGR03435 family)